LCATIKTLSQRQALLWQERASSKARRNMGLDPHLDAVE
jgi:hypothetical protein